MAAALLSHGLGVVVVMSREVHDAIVLDNVRVHFGNAFLMSPMFMRAEIPSVPQDSAHGCQKGTRISRSPQIPELVRT